MTSKFAREWLESKPDAIINYNLVASQLASKLIASKEKLVSNFLTVMNTTKFEDKLSLYVDNDKMGNAYKDGVNAKTSFSQSQLNKVENSISLSRVIQETLIQLVNLGIMNPILFNFPVPQYDNKPQRFNWELAFVGEKIKGLYPYKTAFQIPFDDIGDLYVRYLGWVRPLAGGQSQYSNMTMNEMRLT